MELPLLYKLLEHPVVYKLSQICFAPGANFFLTKRIQQLHPIFTSCTGPILDVGCGPSSWLWQIDLQPVGIDILHSYSLPFQQKTNTAVTGSATNLPFKNNSFAAVFSLGVLHHLDDGAAKQMIMEMCRVCKTEGSIIILDAVLPMSRSRRPVATLIRKKDRGCFMRSQEQQKNLLEHPDKWAYKRYTYTFTGLEILEYTIPKRSLII